MWLGCWFVSHLSFVVTNICVGNSNDTVLTEPWYVVICGRKCHGGEGGGGAIHIPQWFQYEKPAFAVTEQYIFGVWKLSKILVQSNQLAAPSSFSHLPHHTSVKGYFTNMNVKIDTAMTVLRHFTHLVLPWKIIWEQSPSANWISHLNLERCWCCSASAALNILFYHVFVKHDPSAIMKKKNKKSWILWDQIRYHLNYAVEGINHTWKPHKGTIFKWNLCAALWPSPQTQQHPLSVKQPEVIGHLQCRAVNF